jgi:predicted transcriptional regulator
MQEKSFFLAKIQQVKREEMRKRWGLTEKKGIIAWNYEEKRAGLGVFFETPV